MTDQEIKLVNPPKHQYILHTDNMDQVTEKMLNGCPEVQPILNQIWQEGGISMILLLDQAKVSGIKICWMFERLGSVRAMYKELTGCQNGREKV